MMHGRRDGSGADRSPRSASERNERARADHADRLDPIATGNIIIHGKASDGTVDDYTSAGSVDRQKQASPPSRITRAATREPAAQHGIIEQAPSETSVNRSPFLPAAVAVLLDRRSTAATAQTQRSMTFLDAQNMRQTSGLDLSPDGRRCSTR